MFVLGRENGCNLKFKMGCAESRTDTITLEKRVESEPCEERAPPKKTITDATIDLADKENSADFEEFFAFERKQGRDRTIGPFINVNENSDCTPIHGVYAPQFDSPRKRRVHRILTNDSIPEFDAECDMYRRFELYRAASNLDCLEEEEAHEREDILADIGNEVEAV
jgi:hypothetical protein